MKIALVSQHLPERNGRAPDRALDALGEGLTATGHEVHAWSWSPEPPSGELPAWCEWRPLPAEPKWRSRARAIARARSNVVRARWKPPEGSDVVVADGPLSFPAVARCGRTAVILHYRTALEVAVAGRWRPPDLQDLRAERRARRAAVEVLAYSPRVGAGTPATAVPIGLSMPDQPLPNFDSPVAACLADWRWPPNRDGLDVLLRAWPEVRAKVPDARLRLAGRGRVDTRGIPGVTFVGWVDRSDEILSEAALVAFPYPLSSGPKMKVLEAMASGRPVVTTKSGVEGLSVSDGQGAVLAPFEPHAFALAVSDLLAAPSRGRDLGLAGRAAVVETHAPNAVASAQVDAFVRRWPELG